jgi:hypothetical protein
MPKKKRQAKKKSAKLNAAKGGKGSPGDAKAKTARATSTGPKATSEVAPAKSKTQESPEPNRKEAAKKKPKTDLAPLRKKVEEAKAALEKAEIETDALRVKAKDIESKAKAVYVKAVAPYRDACLRAGVKCEFVGGRAGNVTPAVRFLVEKIKNGVKVMLKGKPETEQVILFATLKESIGKAAVAYVEKFIGNSATVGNKQGSLGNRLRAVLAQK